MRSLRPQLVTGKFMLFTLFIVSGWVKINAQNYNPIPTDSVYWVELETGYDGGNCTYYLYRYIYPAGSVVIGGNMFYEYRFNSTTTFTNDYPPWLPCSSDQYTSNDLYILIRNDSINQKVYFYDTNYTHQEKVLYDFNVQVGDTVHPESAICACNEQCPNDTFVVTSIDSINVGTNYRTRITILNISSIDTIYYIESIGADLGFGFNQYCPQEITSHLICYHHKNVLYESPAFIGSSYCSSTISIEAPTEIEELIQTQGHNTYYINNYTGGDVNIRCYNITGSLVFSGEYHESQMLYLNTYPSGIYFMQVTFNGHVLDPYKFIIQNY